MLQPKCRDMGNTLLKIYTLVDASGTGGYGGEPNMEIAKEVAEKAGKEKLLSPEIVTAITSEIQKVLSEVQKAREEHRWIKNGIKFEVLQKTLEKIMFDSVVACECSRGTPIG